MKFPLRLPTFNRSWLMLAGALLLAGAAFALSNKALHDHMAKIDADARAAHKMVKVVVARRDVMRGEPIAADRFSIRDVPAEYVHAAAIRPETFGKYVGVRMAAPLKKGEPLLDVHLESNSAVFSSTLENGNRALTTEVDEVNSISGMLRPGDHIDLMVTAKGSGLNSPETTFTLQSNVEVLATDQITRKREGSGQAKNYTTITLSVSPEDAERIVVAKNSGKMTAVLRNPDDAKPNPASAMNIDDVLPKKPKAAAGRAPVQYIVGGRS
jgi:pilus assembly protein CpaB